MEFTTDQLFFSSMLKELEYKPTNNELSLLSELSDEMANMTISYYPSSGADINDLFYANNKKVEQLGELNPSIYIHSDYYFLDRFDRDITYDQILGSKLIQIVSKIKVHDKEKSINVYKLKTPVSDDFKWLIFFQGYYNESVISDLILSKIKVPLIYSVCDGMTSGMGGCNSQAIPTIMYPLLALDLGIKYIITEQNCKYIKSIIETKYDQFSTWLNNVSLVSENPSTKNLLELSNKELEKDLTIRITAIEEQFLNTNGRLRCFDDRFTDSMVIKKLN